MKDWFEKLTGFTELDYERVRQRLYVENGRLHSHASGAAFGIGTLSLPTLQSLRENFPAPPRGPGRLNLSLLSADVRDLHRQPISAGALFQVASQFNLLEMAGPNITPEDGVTRYAGDQTQGPACAIAAGAATIYRNYFAPVDGHEGQTAKRQLDGLADIGAALAGMTGLAPEALWCMQNGYALASPEGLRAIGGCLASLSPVEADSLRGRLRIGLHLDVEVTDAPVIDGQLVSQAFCSALPIGYSNLAADLWEPFARLILEAAYEATLHVALLNAQRGGSKKVYLTLLGAGAFGNPRSWVLDAMRRALELFRCSDLDIVIVSYGEPPPDLQNLVFRFEVNI